MAHMLLILVFLIFEVSLKISANDTCCIEQTMKIKLDGSGISMGTVPGIDTPTFTSGSSSSCSTNALLKVNFEKLEGGGITCQSSPLCGRRMLQIDLVLSKNRSGWLVNIGDSQSNNGYSGDGSTQQNDAEFEMFKTSGSMYGSDKCLQKNNYVTRIANIAPPETEKVTILIGNNFIRIKNDVGFDERFCEDCYYALNGQSDASSGGINENVYVALNRVVASTYRNGNGVCEATLKWACPWDSYNHDMENITTASMHVTENVTTALMHVTENVTTASMHVTENVTTASMHVTENVTTASMHATENVTTASMHVTENVTTASMHMTENVTSASMHVTENIFIPANDTCCIEQTMKIKLDGSGISMGTVPGIDTPTFTSGSSSSCSTNALLKVNFEKLEGGCMACQSSPSCGRRMLQIDLVLSTTRSGWLVNIGDSQTNNGYSGDGSTQQNDAEFEMVNTGGSMYGSDKCLQQNNYVTRIANIAPPGAKKVTIFIGNNFIRLKNDVGFDERFCEDCYYALSGQSDTSSGGINENVYVALNRVVASTYRNGNGVCEATLKWACPWDSYNHDMENEINASMHVIGNSDLYVFLVSLVCILINQILGLK